MSRAVYAEWTKLRTVRGSTWALFALVALSLLFTAVLSAGSTTTGGAGMSECTGGECNDVVMDSLFGIYVGQFAVVAFAVLAVTSEYATGMIRVTFAADPRRRIVLIAKAAAVTAVVLAIGVATAAASYVIGRSLLTGGGFTAANGYPVRGIADVLRPVGGTGLYLAALALLCLAAGAILRHAAGTITAILGLLFVPLLAGPLLPENIGDQVLRLGPMTAGLAIQRTIERSDSVPIAPWAGLGVAWLWAAVALAIALWLIGRRDA